MGNAVMKLRTEDITTINIKKINSFSEIELPKDISETLFLIDIDDTIITSTSSWGAVKQFFNMVENACKDGYTPKQAKVGVYPRWLISQSIIRPKLVDPDFLYFFEQIISSASVMGLTARQPFVDGKPSIANVTAEQLRKLDIKFSILEGLEFNEKYTKALHPSEELSAQLNLYDDCQALYHQGILFCHDLNSKGGIFQDFFKHFKKYCESNKLPLPNRIVVIDDGEHNLRSMYETCTALGLAYEGYHIQSTNYHFDPLIAKHEEKMLMPRSRSFHDFGKLSGCYR
jgi:hypothetical protein